MVRGSRLAIALGLAVGCGLLAGGSSAQVTGAPAVLAPVERATHYYRLGPGMVQHDSGADVRIVETFEVQIPAGADAALVEISFQYRTGTRGESQIGLSARQVRDDDQVGNPTVRPGHFTVARAPRGAATTVRFLLSDMAGESVYAIRPSAISVGRISTSKMVVTVDIADR